MLTADQIKTAQDVKTEEIEVPEWGGSIKVKAFTLAKRNEVMNGATDVGTGKMDYEKFQVLSFIECCVDPKFAPADFTALKEKSAVVMDRIMKKIMDLSGMQKPEVAKNA